MSERQSERLIEHTLKYVPQAIQHRKALHRSPQLSGKEGPVAEWIAQQIPVQMQTVARTGRIGRIGPSEGPAIALRAELDALPLVEETAATFASQNGAMHACGHDVHQAALIAVARAAAECDLPYALVPFLQPREESYPSGALDIVHSREMERYEVSAVIAAHVHPRIPLGAVATGKGPTNAAADEVSISISGRGGHGAYPHEANNPINALTGIVSGLPEVLIRTVSPMNPAVLSIGRINGGDAANIIPEFAIAEGTLRTMHAHDRERVIEALHVFVDGQARSYGVEAKVVVTRGEPVLENNPRLVDFVDARLETLGLTVSEPMRSCGADDFSFFSERIPGLMAFVGVETENAQPQPSLHHPRFLPDEDAVRRVALSLVSGYLGACDLIDQRREEES